MTAFEHDPRGVIIMPHQHLLRHGLADVPYTNKSLPSVTNIGGALDWIIQTLYPYPQDSVATPAALPAVGNTIGDYRVVEDDGDGKAAGYQWQQREGDVAAKWYKIYDMDWGYDQILSGMLSKTLDFYVYKHGYDDLDSTGAVLTGVDAGQHIFGGASASSHLTLHANAGDGVGAQTGYVQVADNFRPQVGGTWDLGTSSEKWKKVWADDAKIGTLTFDDNTITADGGTVDFADDIITTGEAIFGGNIRINSSTITNPGNVAERQVAYLNSADGDFVSVDETDFSFNGSSDFTIAVWMSIQSWAGSTTAINRWGTAGNRHYIMNFYSVTRKANFAVSLDGTNKAAEVISSTLLSTGTWYFAVARFVAGNGLYISINGGTEDYKAYSGAIYSAASGVDVVLGGTAGLGANANGYCANTGVWGRSLGAYEIQSLYNQGGGKEYADLTVNEKADLISYWNMDEESDGSVPVDRVDSHASNDFVDQSDTNSVLWSRTKGGNTISFESTNLNTSGSVTCGNFTATGTVTLASGTKIGTLTLADGSITDSGGAISFGNENLTTTGFVKAGNLQIAANSITQTATNTTVAFVGNGTGVFTFDKQVQISSGGLQVTGNATFGTGYLQADNIRLDGNTINIQDTNGNLNLAANGTGSIKCGHLTTPSANGTLDLGATALRWKDIFLSGSLGDGTNTVSITNLLTFRAVGAPSVADSLFWDGSKWVASNPDSEIIHAEIGDIAVGDAGHTQFVMLAGRVGSQTIYGGTAENETLTLYGSAHATSGPVITASVFRPASNNTLDLGATAYYFNDAYISGQLKSARLENFTTAGRPAAGSAGRVLWDTDHQDIFADTGSVWLKMSINKWQLEDATTWDGATATVTYTVDGSVEPTRGRVTDARKAVWCLKDNTNNHQDITSSVVIDHPSATQVRVTADVNLPSGTYRLIGIE